MGKRLWVERNKDGSWDAFSEDGAHIKFGKGAKIVVDGTYDADTDAYIGFDEQVVIDATDAGLSDEDAEKLADRVSRHIEKGCTVKHTYVEPTPVRMNVTVKH